MKIETKAIGYVLNTGYIIQSIEVDSCIESQDPGMSDADAFFEINQELVKAFKHNKDMAPGIDVEYRLIFRTFAQYGDAFDWAKSQLK